MNKSRPVVGKTYKNNVGFISKHFHDRMSILQLHAAGSVLFTNIVSCVEN